LESGEAGDADSGGGVVLQPYQLHPREYYEFRLKGVVVHNGTANSGHYYSFVRDSAAEAVDCRADDPEVWRKEKWLRFDDSAVRCGDFCGGRRGGGRRSEPAVVPMQPWPL
jgi:ubiquitin C-terminal hydrolase